MEWPGDRRAIESWLRTRMLSEIGADAGARVGGLDRVRFAVEATGAEIEHLLIDATGVKVTLHASAPFTTDPPPPNGPIVVSRQDGMLRSARLVADPVKVQGCPVHLDATLNDLPFSWVTYDTELTPGDPSSRYGVDESDDPASPTGSFRGALSVDDIGPLLTKAMRPLLSAEGVRLRRLAVSVESPEAERLLVHAVISARWKLLAAKATAEVALHISPGAVVTVERLRVGTRNPVVALGLRLMRAELKAVEGRSYDMNADAETFRIRDLRFTVDERLTVTGRIG
ncbi:hypothetical protein [Microbacterium sp.]|uniref:hypothetical protein n=1 Tax=Microbacterium sp. TaxID=51671 RepID=UPI002810E256|nr:hypothetical protein [Microbacterium sp.]